MKKIIEEKIELLKEFQIKYPTSHIGGSIGLLLRGVDLKRQLCSSDLDITIDELFDLKEYLGENYNDRSDDNDFDFCVKKYTESGYYVKFDIRISPEPSFDVIEYGGNKYNVSKLRDILFWKSKYADKGVKKHEYDLIAIKTGIRPLEPITVEDDSLPF